MLINFSINHRGSEFFRLFVDSKVAKFDLRYLDSGFLRSSGFFDRGSGFFDRGSRFFGRG
jgi:hypothetical protein